MGCLIFIYFSSFFFFFFFPFFFSIFFFFLSFFGLFWFICLLVFVPPNTGLCVYAMSMTRFSALGSHSGVLVDAQMKVPSVENPGLTNVLPLNPGVGTDQNIVTKPGVGQNIVIKPRVGQNIVSLASPTTRNFFIVIIFTFPLHSPYYDVMADTVFSLGLWNLNRSACW